MFKYLFIIFISLISFFLNFVFILFILCFILLFSLISLFNSPQIKVLRWKLCCTIWTKQLLQLRLCQLAVVIANSAAAAIVFILLLLLTSFCRTVYIKFEQVNKHVSNNKNSNREKNNMCVLAH